MLLLKQQTTSIYKFNPLIYIAAFMWLCLQVYYINTYALPYISSHPTSQSDPALAAKSKVDECKQYSHQAARALLLEGSTFMGVESWKL